VFCHSNTNFGTSRANYQPKLYGPDTHASNDSDISLVRLEQSYCDVPLAMIADDIAVYRDRS
jgi:hypothetical protein